MEILLLLACGVMLLVVLKRTNAAHDRTERLDGTLNVISERLDQIARRIATLGPGVGPMPSAATPGGAAAQAPQPAERPTDIIRSPVAETPAPPPPPPPQPSVPEEPPARAAFEALPGAPSGAEPPASEPTPEPAASATPEPETATPAGDDTGVPPPPPRSGTDFGDLEKRFGTQWVVWVGGLALALGGIFLVRYSIEQGLFGPGLRIFFGAILALVLVGLGELARRREIIAGLDKQPAAAHIPSILTAAGTTVAYADVWAAYALYDFLSPAVAFVLLGIVALATLAAALRHGPALGGLGLIGAYVTPILVSSTQPSYWALYVYLTVVTAAAYALARIRLWRWLAITAACFSIFWMLVGIGDPSNGSLPAHAFYAVAGFALAAYFLVAGLFKGPPIERGRIDPVSCGVLAGYLFGAFMLVIATAHAPLAMTTLFVLAAATVAIAWRSRSRAAGGAGRGRVRDSRDRALGARLVVRHHGAARRSVVRRALSHADRRHADARVLRRSDRVAVRRRGLLRARPHRAAGVRDPVGDRRGRDAGDHADRGLLPRHAVRPLVRLCRLALCCLPPRRPSPPSNCGNASRGPARPRPARSSRPARSRGSR